MMNYMKMQDVMQGVVNKKVLDWFYKESYFYKFAKETNMKETKVTCDHCNKEINKFDVYYVVRLADNVNHEYHFHDKRCMRRWAGSKN